MLYWTDNLSRVAGEKAPSLRVRKIVGVYLKIATLLPLLLPECSFLA